MQEETAMTAMPIISEMQCGTCKFEGLRTCAYHGYSKDYIPTSCPYKIGYAAEDAQYNLRGMKENGIRFARMRLEEALKNLDITYSDYRKLLDEMEK